jgi:hypothetical protein
MLPTKLVIRKTPIPQVAPKNAFPFCGVLAQITSVTHKTIQLARRLLEKAN